jgi:hypothetical protein
MSFSTAAFPFLEAACRRNGRATKLPYKESNMMLTGMMQYKLILVDELLIG